MPYGSMSAVKDDIIGSAESCRILGIDKATLSRWVTAGRIEAVHKLPGRNGAYLFRRESIETVAAARSNEASA